ncbi:hypothetical protein H4Q26_014223 [Puccinia striiformis f. sp. tritici PST-130]|nr:hypothetical protein H4Q26_014223 [Puccinia striiformis f. sp. tritici PST-130]
MPSDGFDCMVQQRILASPPRGGHDSGLLKRFTPARVEAAYNSRRVARDWIRGAGESRLGAVGNPEVTKDLEVVRSSFRRATAYFNRCPSGLGRTGMKKCDDGQCL